MDALIVPAAAPLEPWTFASLSLTAPGCGCPQSFRGIHIGWQDVKSKKKFLRRRWTWFLFFLVFELVAHGLAVVSTIAALDRVLVRGTVDVCCASDAGLGGLGCARSMGWMRSDANGRCSFVNGALESGGCSFDVSATSTTCANATRFGPALPQAWASAYNATCARTANAGDGSNAQTFQAQEERRVVEQIGYFLEFQLAAIVFDACIDTASVLFDFDLLEFILSVIVLIQLGCCDVSKAGCRCDCLRPKGRLRCHRDLLNATTRTRADVPRCCLTCKKVRVCVCMCVCV